MARTRGGGRFIVSALGTIALLVFGLGITAWFTTSHAAVADLDFTSRAIQVDVTGAIRPSTVELCANGTCISAWTYELEGSTFAKLGFATLCIGIAFGLVFAWVVNRRIGGHEVGRLLRWLGYGLGGAVVLMTLVCLFAIPPDALAYDIIGGGRFVEEVRNFGITSEPSLGLGGFLAIAGVLLGMFAIFEARPHDEEVVVEPEPERLFRIEPFVPPRGVETDPFRAPPQPPPIAVVRHDRPATAPIVADPTEEPPKLLR